MKSQCAKLASLALSQMIKKKDKEECANRVMLVA